MVAVVIGIINRFRYQGSVIRPRYLNGIYSRGGEYQCTINRLRLFGRMAISANPSCRRVSPRKRADRQYLTPEAAQKSARRNR